MPATNIELSKSVRVEYKHAADPMHLTSRGKSGGFRIPAILEITGRYTPPLAAAGRVFDAALGEKIAAETAQRLLS